MPPPLRALESRLLQYLKTRPGQVVSRGDLLEHVWGYDRRMRTRAVDIAIARLRKHVEADPRHPRHLISVRGQGYRWQAELQSSTPPRSTNTTNMTDALQPLIGRQALRERLHALLDEGARVVSLTGLGGAGKTRLAVACAHERRAQYPGGQWLISFEASPTPADVVRATAVTLGLQLGGGDATGQLRAALAARPPTLFILDALPPLTDATSAHLDAMIRAAPNHHFLLTRRVREPRAGHHCIEVGPMTAAAAAQLFCERAHEVRPSRALDPELVSAIVAQLEGHPLAIELAAARSSVLSLSALLQRLQKSLSVLDRRTKTGPRLNGLLQWSWDMLSTTEQTTLLQCCVFRRGFTLDAAEQIVHVPEGSDVLDSLQCLEEHALVAVQDPDAPALRFTLPRAVHEFVTTLPAGTVHADAARRHAAHFAEWARQEWRDGVGGDAEDWRDRQLELENLHAAAHKNREQGRLSDMAACAAMLSTLVELCGPYTRAIEMLEATLSLPLQPRDRGSLLQRHGWLLLRAGHIQEARAECEAGLAVARDIDACTLQARLLSDLAYLHQRRGELASAEALFVEALSIVSVQDSGPLVAHIQGNYAILLAASGRPDAAEAAYRAALRLHVAHGDARSEGHLRGNLGTFLYQQGRHLEADHLCTQALDLHRRTGNRPLEGNTLSVLAALAHERGDSVTARIHFESALAIQRDLGSDRAVGLLLGNLGHLALHQGDLGGAQRLLREAIEVGDRVWPLMAGGHRGTLAEVLLQQGRVADAWRLVEAAEPLVRDASTLQLGHVLCTRARVATLRGDADAAAHARSEAQSIVDQLQLGPGSALCRALAADLPSAPETN